MSGDLLRASLLSVVVLLPHQASAVVAAAVPDTASVAPPRGPDQGAAVESFVRIIPQQRASFVPGELIVALKDNITAPADVVFAAGAPLQTVAADQSDSLDRLNTRFAVRTIRSLFDVSGATARATTLSARRQAWVEASSAMTSTYPQRRLRAPQGAGMPDLAHTYILRAAPNADIAAMAAAYAGDAHVRFAQPNYIYTVQAEPLPAVAVIPNDPFINDPGNPGFWRVGSWGQSYPDLWGLRNIQALEAWNLFADPLHDPGHGVVVAVVDTGIDASHPDIVGNTLTGRDFTTSIFDVFCNFIRHKRSGGRPIDRNGHGTHVSGTIAALADNGLGIAGVAPRATILPVKGIDDSGCGTSTDLAQAIVYAAHNGADVLNLSWGGIGEDPSVRAAIQQAYALGVVIVAAAGNDATDVSAVGFTPAQYPEVITTSAFDPDDFATDFTNFGEKIDVAAPGGGSSLGPPNVAPQWNILSLLSTLTLFPIDAVVDDQYLRLGGTSQAAPHVAGLAALLLSSRPDFSNEEIRQALRIAADPVAGPGFDLHAGYGRINANRALQVDQVLTAMIATPSERDSVNLAQTPLAIQGTASGPGFTSFQLFAASGYEPQQFLPIGAPTTSPVMNGSLATWSPDRLQYPDGWQTLLLQATDAEGRVFESRRLIGTLYDVPNWPVLNVPAGSPIDFGLPSAGGITVGRTGTAPGNTLLATGFGQGLFTWSSDGRLLSNTPITEPDFQPPALGDVDGEGMLEAFVGSGDGLVIMNGSSVKTVPGIARDAQPVVLDDLNGDGTLDVISIDLLGHIHVEDRTGTPASLQWPQQPLVPGRNTPPALFASDLAVGDLDNSGMKEIVMALKSLDQPGPYSVYVLEADGTVRWSHPFGADSVNVNAIDVVLGDVDGDGWPEVVAYESEEPQSAVTTTSHWSVIDRHGQTKAEWTLTRTGGSATGRLEGHLALADLDGDGIPEIITLMPREGVGQPLLKATILAAWHADGTAVTGFPVVLDGEVAVNPVVADVDGDGLPDIVSSLGQMRSRFISNPVYAWNRSGQPLPGWPRSLIRTAAEAVVAIGQLTTTLVDLDGNGTLDLVTPIGGPEIHAMDLQVPVAARAMQWPTYRHDVRHTGRYQVPLCGNGVVDPGEECDDGNTRSCDGCSSACRLEHSVCGNGIVEACEECDDGNGIDGDGCDSNCTVTACGNGIVTAGEQCDDGNRINTDTCKDDCTWNVCGDGVIHAGIEECDDGNLVAGDGCSSTCQSELIPGNAPSSAKCNQEWLTVPVPPRNRSGLPANRLVCTDDDPSCDFGAVTGDGACTFQVAMCFNVTDRRIKTAQGSPACHPSSIESFRVSRPNPNRLRNAADNANYWALLTALNGLGLPPVAAENACTPFADVVVPVTGGSGSRTLQLWTRSPFSAHTNSLTLVCQRRR